MAWKQLAAILGLVALVSGCDGRETADGTADQTAPELAVLDMDRQAVKLADLKGKVVLVNFWLVECGPCLVEMPEFESVYQEYRDQGFEILAINMGQESAAIRNASRRLDVTYPLLEDPLKITTERYSVQAAPTSFLIDREGILRERINSPMTGKVLEKKLTGLL